MCAPHWAMRDLDFPSIMSLESLDGHEADEWLGWVFLNTGVLIALDTFCDNVRIEAAV